MARLSVKANKLATPRNARDGDAPSLVACAAIALDAGAAGITVHPHPDQRHVRPRDVAALAALAALVCGRRDAELNIQGNPFDGVLEHVERELLTQATLVPDTRRRSGAITAGISRPTPAGSPDRATRSRARWAFSSTPTRARSRSLRSSAIAWSFTQPYVRAHARGEHRRVLPDYARAAEEARRRGLGVNAGHDSSLANVGDFLAGAAGVDEPSIGHALVADAVARYVAAVSLR